MKRLAIALAWSLALGACGGEMSYAPEEEVEDSVASIELGLSIDTGFIGNSVEVCAIRGTRAAPVPADGKYPCQSELPCTCIGFDATSQPIVRTEKASFGGLCPSADLPVATWQFDFTLYSDTDCTDGMEVTGGPSSNVTCYDLSDLATRDYPNRSFETLLPGSNRNTVVCIIGSTAPGSIDTTGADASTDTTALP